MTEKKVDNFLGDNSEQDEIRAEFELISKRVKMLIDADKKGASLSPVDFELIDLFAGYKSASSRIAELEEEVARINTIIQNFAEHYHSMGDSGSLYVVNQICSAIESK